MANEEQPKARLGTGEGEVPLSGPLPQNVSLRTMASDIASMQKSGGGEPRPYTPPPPVRAVPPTPTPETRTFSIPKSDVATPPERPFVPPPPPPPRPAASPASGATPRPPQLPKRRSRKALMVIGGIVVALGLAALGYFVVYPLIAGEQGTAPTKSTDAPALPAAPDGNLTAYTPEEPPSGPAAPESPEIPTTEPETPEPLSTHTSLLVTPANVVQELTVEDLNLTMLRQAIGTNVSETPILRELVLRNAVGTLITAQDILPLFDPDTFTPAVTDGLNSNLSLVSYTDRTGAWLAIVLEAKSDAPIATLKSQAQLIEFSARLTNFFPSNPGTPGEWRSGQTNGIENRYTTFSTPGFALNYGWVGTKLVISASYDAFKDLVTRVR